jgi:hypothetical protein
MAAEGASDDRREVRGPGKSTRRSGLKRGMRWGGVALDPLRDGPGTGGRVLASDLEGDLSEWS